MLQFDVKSALLGGACIGLSACYNFVLQGRVLGVSGELSRALCNTSKRSIFFLSGLALAPHLLPSPTTGLELSLLSTSRVAIASTLVGLGAALANGCTSGHGISGLVRFSKRSFVAVGLFMTSAMATATLLTSSASIPQGNTSDTPLSALAWYHLASVICAPGILGVLTHHAPHNSFVRSGIYALLQVATGMLFGTGLLVSGMANPTKTLSFLDLSRIPEHWDLSMLGVFAGALPLSYIGYRIVKSSGALLLKDNEKVQLPENVCIDRKLIAGSVMFGIGWGLIGLCPGPTLAYASAHGIEEVKAVLAMSCMVGGIVTGRFLILHSTVNLFLF